jgi:hypothetical protein
MQCTQAHNLYLLSPVAHSLKEEKGHSAPYTEGIDNHLDFLTGEVAVLAHGSFMFLSICFVSAGM